MNGTAAPSAWWALALGAAIVLGYELRVIWIGRRTPHRVARAANARLRAEWVRALAAKPGFEIVAVQTLRNSLMSATITASTAALCLMGALSMAGSRLAAGIGSLHANEVSPIELLEILLMTTLFASFVCSSAVDALATTMWALRCRCPPARRSAMRPSRWRWTMWSARLPVRLGPALLPVRGAAGGRQSSTRCCCCRPASAWSGCCGSSTGRGRWIDASPHPCARQGVAVCPMMAP